MTTLVRRAKPICSGLIICLGALTGTLSMAHDNCTPYTAEFRLEGATPFGPLTGGAIYNIGDLPPQPGQVSVVLKGSAAFDPTAPVIQTKFSDMVLFPPGPDGSLNILTAIDRVVGKPTGPGTFESVTKSRITGGAGIYEGVTGKARSTSLTSVDLATGYTVSDVTVRGRLCGLGEAHSD